MILRRVMEHLRKQEWTAIGIDFVIVVLGVFLGIQVSNWNQAAADRRAESAYLSQLQGDLQRIEAEVSSQVEFEQFQGRLVVTVGDLIASSPSASAWAPVVSQLSWRGLVAVSNESTARRLLDATNALEARIADRLGGGRS